MCPKSTNSGDNMPDTERPVGDEWCVEEGCESVPKKSRERVRQSGTGNQPAQETLTEEADAAICRHQKDSHHVVCGFPQEQI